MVWMQLTLAGVHLLPAFPLDAGRVLRSALDRSHGSLKGARAAAILGQGISFALVLLGFRHARRTAPETEVFTPHAGPASS